MEEFLRWSNHNGRGKLGRQDQYSLTGYIGSSYEVFREVMNDSPVRCFIWETMAQTLPQTCRWLLLGDFNMVEFWVDKTQKDASMILIRERILFDAMKATLQVGDNPRLQGSLKFTSA